MDKINPAPKASDNPALMGLIELFESDEIDVIILTGSAGTGKTTLVGQLIDTLRASKTKVQLLATTGRAAKILQNKTGKTATTIHSAIYAFNSLKSTDDISHDKDLNINEAGQLYLQFDLKFSRQEPEEQVEAYIVDEASMLTHETNSKAHTAQFGSGSLMNDLFHFCRGKKIMFVGDPCQLPPISHNINSIALDPYFIANQYNKRVGLVELTRVWRQAEGNEILKVATWYRDRIITKSAAKGMKIPPPEGLHIHTMKDQSAMMDKYLEVIGPDKDFNKATFLAHSNKSVHQINHQIRKRLNYSNAPQLGDLLSVVQNSYTTPLVNGDLVVLESIKEDVTRANLTFSRVRLRALHSGANYDTLLINELLFNSESSLNKEDAGRLLIDFDQRMRKRGVKRNTAAYKEGMRTDPFLNALRCKFGYALTTHKAQGGEWEEVFVAMDYPLTNMEGEAAARWYYTAFTRASHRLYINDGPWIDSGAPKVTIFRPVVKTY